MSQNLLTASEKQELLDAHNRFRSIVNPTASNMEATVGDLGTRPVGIKQTLSIESRYRSREVRLIVLDSKMTSPYSLAGQTLFFSFLFIGGVVGRKIIIWSNSHA